MRFTCGSARLVQHSKRHESRDHEMASCNMLFVIQLDGGDRQPWQALRAPLRSMHRSANVHCRRRDVDPDSMDAVLWALSYSMQPHRDAEIIRGKVPRLDRRCRRRATCAS